MPYRIPGTGGVDDVVKFEQRIRRADHLGVRRDLDIPDHLEHVRERDRIHVDDTVDGQPRCPCIELRRKGR